MGQTQLSRGMATHQLYDQLEIYMKAMHMEFKLVILQLAMDIRKNSDRVLTDIILDYATRLYREKEFTRAKYLDLGKHIHETRENLM